MCTKSLGLYSYQQLHPLSVLAVVVFVASDMFPGIATPGWFGIPLGAEADHNSGVSMIFMNEKIKYDGLARTQFAHPFNEIDEGLLNADSCLC